MGARALAFYAWMAAVYLLFDGYTRQVIENSFHRPHWPVLMLALVAAPRMLTRSKRPPPWAGGPASDA